MTTVAGPVYIDTGLPLCNLNIWATGNYSYCYTLSVKCASPCTQTGDLSTSSSYSNLFTIDERQGSHLSPRDFNMINTTQVILKLMY